MKSSDVFPSKWLKATDLKGTEPTVIIASVSMEEVGQDRRPVMHFQGKEKGLVLNSTNWDRVAMMYGDESDDWAGKALTLYSDMVQYKGQTVPGLRVRPPKRNGNSPAAPPPRQNVVEQRKNYDLSHNQPGSPPDDGMDDTIPF